MMVSLNDLDTIRKNDKSGMLAILLSFPDQCREAVEIASRVSWQPLKRGGINNIVISGLGGSAIGGDLLRDCVRDEINLPILVNRDYTIPRFVMKETLFFAISYSGDTEETLSAYGAARETGAKVVGITSGGELNERCRKDGFPAVLVPKGMPPRTAVGYLFLPLLVAIAGLNLIPVQSEAIREMIALLKELKVEYDLTIPTEKNPAKQLAEQFYQRLPLIYGSFRHLNAVAMRWQTQLNENSKSIAHMNIFPEMNHNEIVGWEKLEHLRKHFSVIILRDREQLERIQRRIEITHSLIKKGAASITQVWSKGDSILARLFSLLYLGDFASYYLAAIYNVDPTPVERITLLKRRLAELG